MEHIDAVEDLLFSWYNDLNKNSSLKGREKYVRGTIRRGNERV